MTDQARDIIRRAADLVEQGWCQHTLTEIRDGKTCYCAMEAIHKAGESESLVCWYVADLGVRHHLKSLFGNPSVTTYNDAPNRTQAEVVAMLREVAES